MPKLPPQIFSRVCFTIILVACYSAVALSFCKIASQTGGNSRTAIMAATFIGAGIGALIMGLMTKKSESPKRKDVKKLLLLGLAGCFASGYFLVLAEKGPVADWIEKGIIPIIMILLGGLFKQQIPSFRSVPGVWIAFFGYLLLAVALTFWSKTDGNWFHLFVLPAVGGIGSGISVLVMSELANRPLDPVNRYFAMAARYLPVGFICGAVALIEGLHWNYDALKTLCLAALVGGILINITLWIILAIMKRHGVSTLTIAFLFVPMVTSFLSWPFLKIAPFGETPAAIFIPCIIIILIGAMIDDNLIKFPSKRLKEQ